MTSPSQPPRPSDDALRAAMDQVRGVRRAPARTPEEPTSAPSEVSTDDGAASTSRRRPWDVRARVRDDLARVPTPSATAWPRPLAGLIAGAWAALMSWLVFAGVVLVSWVFSPLGSGAFADVMRASGAMWLVADGGIVLWQNATISLVPLLATLLIVLFQRRAGAWLATAVDIQDARSARSPLAYAVAAAASAQALVAASIAHDTLQVPFWRSLLGSAIVACLGFGWGVARVVGWSSPEAMRPALRISSRLAFGLTAAAVIAVVASAIAHWAGFTGVLGVVAGDRTSTAQVLLLCVTYLPTIVGWAIAFLVGPGFSLGLGTSVSLSGVSISALPPIPLLALVPEAVHPYAPLALLLPLIVAVWATRGALGERPWQVIGSTLLFASSSAVLLSNAVFGGIGPGRLVAVGPLWWHVTLAVAGWLGAGFAVHAVTAWVRSRFREAREVAADDAGKLGA